MSNSEYREKAKAFTAETLKQGDTEKNDIRAFDYVRLPTERTPALPIIAHDFNCGERFFYPKYPPNPC